MQYRLIRQLLAQSKNHIHYDNISVSVVMDYLNSTGSRYQVWFDDENTLRQKSEYAMMKRGLRGMGMWTIDSVDYTADSGARELWKAMLYSTY
jgi:spore germination protein YaaH